MKKFLITLIAIFTFSSFAQAGDFCKGFQEGYVSVKGSSAVVPPCPPSPPTSPGSTEYDEGFKAGIKAAKKR